MKSVIISMLLLLILIALVPHHTIHKIPEHFKTPCTKEQVAYYVILAMHDVATSSLVNKNDINVVYSVWSSQMIKRSVPEEYITPQFFQSIHDLHRSGKLSSNNVIALL